MLERQQLLALESMLDGETLDAEVVKGLKRAITSELWAISNRLTPKEQRLVQEAERQGKVQVVKRIIGDLPEPGTRSAIARAQDGKELLGLLGLEGK